MLLEAEGYRFVEADTAMRAEIEARSHKPDLLLVDLGLPDEIHLTPLVYRVLENLARHLGSIVIQKQLVREVCGPERLGDTRSLRVCVKNLRNKLEPDPRKPRHIVTEAGLGYRLRCDEFMGAKSPSAL